VSSSPKTAPSPAMPALEVTIIIIIIIRYNLGKRRGRLDRDHRGSDELAAQNEIFSIMVTFITPNIPAIFKCDLLAVYAPPPKTPVSPLA